MAKHGVPVSPKMTRRAQTYVANKIYRARRRRAKSIDPRAVAFAGDALVNMLVWEYGAYSAVVLNGLEQVGRYTIDPGNGARDAAGVLYGDLHVVEWKPKRARRAERIGTAKSWRKAARIIESDHKYRFSK